MPKNNNFKNLSKIFKKEDNASYQEIDDMLKNNSSSDEPDDILSEKQDNKKKTNKYIIIGSTVVAISVLGSLIFFIPDRNNESHDSGSGPNMVEIDENADADKNQYFYLDNPNLTYPVQLEDWEQNSRLLQENVDLGAKVFDKYSKTFLGSSSFALPPEAAGFTADRAKQYNENGAPNTFYSYWTAESFTRETGDLIERILNPVYGAWRPYQYSKNPGNESFDFNLISDMFSSSWIDKNADKKFGEYVPLYADWEGNDYGMADQLLTSGPRWIGKVIDGNCEFSFNEKSNGATVDYTSNVVFTAWSKNQTKIEKKGVLKMKLIPNNNQANSSDHTVIIDDASLTIE